MSTLITGEVPVKRRSKMQSIYAYQDLHRERLTAQLDKEWKTARARDELQESQALAFRNRRLRELLAAEPPDVQAEVEAHRIRVWEKNVINEVKADIEESLLLPGEDALPEAEWRRLMMARKRQR